MRISVVPEELRGFGARVAGVGAHVGAPRGGVLWARTGPGAAAPGTESGEAGAVLCSAWSGALGRAGASIAATGGAVGAAAAVYQLVDSTVMPLLGGGD